VQGDVTGRLGFVLNEGAAFTTDPLIQVRFLADLSTIRGYSLSLDPAFRYASLIDLHQATTTFVLPNQSGSYTIYGKLFSKTGHPSARFQTTIEYRPNASISPSVPVLTMPMRPVVVFSRTLRPGSKGEDVRQLQRFLNASNVLVATKGAGSPGQETTYFGPALTRALKRFQEAHRAQILTPVGLTAGTGVFGTKTRQLIQQLIETSGR
jgi:hypothetical protein